MIFNKALNLLIATLENKLTVQELELKLPPEPQVLITTIVIIVFYLIIKALEEKEHRMGELEGFYIPNLVLKKLSPRGAILQLSPSLKPGPLIQSNWSLNQSSLTELRDFLALVLAFKKTTDLYRDMRRYTTTF